MNKFISAFLATVGICASSHAQLSYGVKAGLNVSRMVFERPDSTWKLGFLPSFHVGMYGVLDISDKFSASAEVLISDKGFKEDPATHLLYASIPVMIQYKPVKNFSIGVGPSLGILITSWGKERDYAKKVLNNPLDFGAVAGVQYAVTSSIALSLRFEQGFSNVIGKDAAIPAYTTYIDGNDPLIVNANLRDNGFKFRNQCFQLSACYKL